MESTPATPGEQPAAPVEAPAGGEQPQPGDIQSAIAGLDASTAIGLLEAVSSGEAPVLPEAPAAVVAPVVAPAPASEQPQPPEAPAEAAIETEVTNPPESTSASKAPNRLSVRSLPPEEQSQLAEALTLVRENKAPNVLAALQQLAGPAPVISGAAPAQGEDAPASQPAPASAPAVAPEVAAIQSTIETLREQRRVARADYNTDEELRLTDQIEDAQANLIRAEIAAKQQQSSASDYQGVFKESVARVEAAYPELLDESSVFFRVFEDRVEAARSRNDPAIQDPNHLEAFAAEVAKDLKRTEAPAPAPATPATPEAPPARPSRAVGADLAPGHQQQTRVTADQAKMLIQTAPLADVLAVLYDE